MAAGGTKTVVFKALAGNAAIAVTKFIAAAYTGSSAMFSEAVHSVVDAFTMPANQLAVARATPPDQIAAGQGLLGALGLATAAATAAVGGWVYGSFGAFVLYGGTAVLMGVLLVAAWHLGDELR